MRKAIFGIVGVSDGGCPIVTNSHSCFLWALRRPDEADCQRTCESCYYSAFPKSGDLSLQIAACRHPENKVPVYPDSKNEYLNGGLKG